MAKGGKRNCRGFTLVEMLCAIVVLILISGIMATGVGLGVKTLRKSLVNSESQVLCATLRTAVSDELRYAGTTTVSTTGVTFFSQNYGEYAAYGVNDDGQVTLKGEKIIPSKSYPHGIKGEVDIISYDDQTGIFSVEVTVTDDDGSLLSETDFQVERLNFVAES